MIKTQFGQVKGDRVKRLNTGFIVVVQTLGLRPLLQTLLENFTNIKS